MSSLRFLYISATSFEYEGIPTFLSSLSNLEELDVSNSRYTQGPIRTEAFEGMSKLSYLDLGQNVYTSTIPETLTVLPNLEQLYLDDTLFTVNMTLNFLTQMDLLREFWMDNTVVMTSIPSEIGRLSNLASLSMTFCGLTGTLPSEIGLLTVLDRLWLRQNLLQGSIPDNIAGLENLKYFYIEGNRLGGSIPVGICDKRAPQGSLAEIGADCDSDNQYLVACPCCSCCGPFQCYDFGLDTGNNI
jgi:Leucine-rich repeat (LRR) protein